MQQESIEELKEKVNRLVESLDSGDKNKASYKEFITHKYILLATHAHMEGAKIYSVNMNKEEKLKKTKH